MTLVDSLNIKTVIHVVLVLLLVDVLAASSSGGSDWSTSVQHSFVLLQISQHTLNVGVNMIPPALIFVLFLGPQNICIGVLLNFITNEIKWEGAKLFNAGYSNGAFKTAACTLLEEFVVNFASTENLTFYAAGIRFDLLGVIRQNSLKLSAR